MPKVYLDEIDALLGSGTTSSLSTDSQEGKSLNSAIDSYINSSKSTLKGAQWDKSRAKLQTFNEALKTRMELAEKMGEAIKNALQLLKDYLGEDAMLDTSQLVEYQKQRDICQNSINQLTGMLSETHSVTTKDSEGRDVVTTELVYDSAAIQSQIDLAKETLVELDRIITKIEGLEEVYNKAMGILEEGFAGLQAFQSSVSSITPSGIFSYKPSTSLVK